MHKKRFLDSIKIENPCSENWDEMTGNDRIRFCSHCSKDVNNLSAMTRKKAMRLVRESGGRLCVRYHTDPRTNAPIFAKVSSFARHGAFAGVLSASVLTGAVYAQGEAYTPPLVQIERTQTPGDPTAKVSGYVTDPHGAAIAYALVSITNQETLVSQIQNASAEGFYEFKDLAAGNYKIRIEAGGFEPREIGEIFVYDASDIRRDSQLDLLKVEAAVEVKGEDIQQFVTVGAIGVGSYEPSNELVNAVLDDDFENVKARVIMRAKINVRDKSRDGMSPLHAAVEMANLEIAEYLLTHGAKANIRDFEKQTPLMMMDEDGTLEMFELLVRFGAKTNLLDKQKNNLLHHFAGNDVPAEVIRRVAAYGVDVNGINKEGKTPLMMAVENGDTNAVRALIESGADVNIRTRDGRSALSMLAEAETEIRSILETYGAVSH